MVSINHYLSALDHKAQNLFIIYTRTTTMSTIQSSTKRLRSTTVGPFKTNINYAEHDLRTKLTTGLPGATPPPGNIPNSDPGLQKKVLKFKIRRSKLHLRHHTVIHPRSEHGAHEPSIILAPPTAPDYPRANSTPPVSNAFDKLQQTASDEIAEAKAIRTLSMFKQDPLLAFYKKMQWRLQTTFQLMLDSFEREKDLPTPLLNIRPDISYFQYLGDLIRHSPFATADAFPDRHVYYQVYTYDHATNNSKVKFVRFPETEIHAPLVTFDTTVADLASTVTPVVRTKATYSPAEYQWRRTMSIQMMQYALTPHPKSPPHDNSKPPPLTFLDTAEAVTITTRRMWNDRSPPITYEEMQWRLEFKNQLLQGPFDTQSDQLKLLPIIRTGVGYRRNPHPYRNPSHSSKSRNVYYQVCSPARNGIPSKCWLIRDFDMEKKEAGNQQNKLAYHNSRGHVDPPSVDSRSDDDKTVLLQTQEETP